VEAKGAAKEVEARAEGERAVVAALAKVAAEAEAMVAMVVTTAAVVTSFART
jgi:hypothetical protein